MQRHDVCYCCSTMHGYINSGLVTVNYTAGTAHMNVLNVPTPEDSMDQTPVMTRIPINKCPNCGDTVIVYDEVVPAPTYTRALLTGASCNDISCRFINRSNLTCQYQFRNDAGCYSTDDAAKQAYSDLRDKVHLGWNEMVNE